HLPLLLTPVRTAPHAHAHNITRISVEVISLKGPARCGIVLSNHIARVVRDHSDNLFRFRRRPPLLRQPMAGNCPASRAVSEGIESARFSAHRCSPLSLID